MKGGLAVNYSRIADLIVFLVTVVFFWSFMNVMEMDPVTWIPIAGLYVSASFLLPIYKAIIREE